MRRPLSIIAYVLALSVLGGVAVAEVKHKPAPQTAPVQGVTKWDQGQKELLGSLDPVAKGTKSKDGPVLVQVGSFIFKLAVVLGLAYASIYALKRFTGLKNAIGGGRRRIKVVENANLGSNRSLHLIEVGAKTLLVASTPSQISLLAELGADDMPEADAGFESSKAERLEGSERRNPATLQPVNFQTLLAGQNIAQLIRGSSTFLQEKIMQLGRLRGKLKDG